MPWNEVTLMSLRFEFIHLALSPDNNFSMLCRRFGISRKTGYKWLHRFKREGSEGLVDRYRGVPGAVLPRPLRLWKKKTWVYAIVIQRGAVVRSRSGCTPWARK